MKQAGCYIFAVQYFKRIGNSTYVWGIFTDWKAKWKTRRMKYLFEYCRKMQARVRSSSWPVSDLLNRVVAKELQNYASRREIWKAMFLYFSALQFLIDFGWSQKTNKPQVTGAFQRPNVPCPPYHKWYRKNVGVLIKHTVEEKVWRRSNVQSFKCEFKVNNLTKWAILVNL